MVDNCAICNIINGTSKSYVIYEDEFFIAFLDAKPLFIGHSLLAPKHHFETIYDLPAVQGNIFLTTIQKVGTAITAALKAEGTFIAVNNKVSQSIDHLHIHLVPRKKGDGLKGFFWPRMKYKSEVHILEVQQAIKNEMNKKES